MFKLKIISQQSGAQKILNVLRRIGHIVCGVFVSDSEPPDVSMAPKLTEFSGVPGEKFDLKTRFFKVVYSKDGSHYKVVLKYNDDKLCFTYPIGHPREEEVKKLQPNKHEVHLVGEITKVSSTENDLSKVYEVRIDSFRPLVP
ncbi:MAG: hypothetical protein AABZ14_09195 [Candidatus Margulisiibacteriota bacterium]